MSLLTTFPTATGAACCIGDVCGPIVRAPITDSGAAALALVLKALADPTRLRLLSLIAAREGGEACVCDLTEPIGLSQPTVSHHLKLLLEAGFVARTRRGTWSYYQLVPGALDAVAATLVGV